MREKDDAALEMKRLAAGAQVWLSAVVLAELRAGAGSRDKEQLEKLRRTFERCERILVPNARDWAEAGRLLALMGAKHGYERIGKGRLMNDALIATSAARTGTTIVSFNARDFSRLAEFRQFRWRVVGNS